MAGARLAVIAMLVVAGLAVAGAVASMAPAGGRTPAVSAAKVQQFHGSITTSNRMGHWVDVRVMATSRVVRFHTVPTTVWHDCGWSDMDRGHLVSIAATKSHGMWLATAIKALHHPEAEA